MARRADCPAGVIQNAFTGALGGWIGGAVKVPKLPFDNRYITPELANALNDDEAIHLNSGVGNFSRNAAGAFTGNVDPNDIKRLGKPANGCGCKQ